ncbi:MAG: STAS domain-containing protein [Chloroflexi bacterium]|nr:STAS domain-containing protein [Chloroflexota bacterium]
MLAQLLQSHTDQIQVLEVIGRIDANNAVWLTLDVDNALASGRNQVIFDLSGVLYINSAGLRELVQIWNNVQHAGGMVLIVNPSDYARKVLELVGLDSVFAMQTDPNWDLFARRHSPRLHRQTRYYS